MFSAIAERRGPARRRFWSRLLERAPPPEAWLIAKAFASGDGGQLDAERNDLLKQGKRYRSHANSRIGWLAPAVYAANFSPQSGQGAALASVPVCGYCLLWASRMTRICTKAPLEIMLQRTTCKNHKPVL